jgi:hypothetical protein
VMHKEPDPRELVQWRSGWLGHIAHRQTSRQGDLERVLTRWHNLPRTGCHCATPIYTHTGGGPGSSSKPWSSKIMIISNKSSEWNPAWTLSSGTSLSADQHEWYNGKLSYRVCAWSPPADICRMVMTRDHFPKIYFQTKIKNHERRLALSA